MRAVILAAGRGSRLGGVPKAVVRLCGLTLLERVLLSLRQAGLREALVVVGYQAERVRRALGAGVPGMRVEFVDNPQWPRGNGTSLWAARDRLTGPFLLLMCDHVFDPSLLRLLLAEPPDEPVLLVDERWEGMEGLQDATKVWVEGGRVRELGKDLGRFNAVDCGLFLLNELAFAALEEAFARGDYELAGGMRVLARWGKLRALPIGSEAFWQDVDTPEDLRLARRKLLRSLVSPRDGFVSRTINRRLSLRISAALAGLPLHPNLISLACLGLGALSGALFATGWPALGGLAAQACSVMDGVDGEIARLKFQQTPYGAFLDAVLDRYADALIVLGIMIGAWPQGGVGTLVAGVLALVGMPMSMLQKEKFQAVSGRPYLVDRYDGWLRYLPVNRDGRLLLVMVGGLLHLLVPLLWALAAITNLAALGRLWRVWGALREVRP